MLDLHEQPEIYPAVQAAVLQLSMVDYLANIDQWAKH